MSGALVVDFLLAVGSPLVHRWSVAGPPMVQIRFVSLVVHLRLVFGFPSVRI